MKKQDIFMNSYVVIKTPFEIGVYKIETDDQLEQAKLSNDIVQYTGNIDDIKGINKLSELINRLKHDESNLSRICQIKENINLLLRRNTL